MAELQEHLNEFISQNAKTERTIRCDPDGINFERFAALCDLAGAPEEIYKSLSTALSCLRSAASKEEEKSSAASTIVKGLIEKTSKFVTLEQYTWLARTTIAAQLLNNLPANVSILIRRLSFALESIDLAAFNHTPHVINNIAKCLKEDIPLNGVDLLYIIKKLAIANSPVLYYTAVALLFAELHTVTQPSTKIEQYRVQSVTEFLNHLEVLNMQYLQMQRHNLRAIYHVLKLVSLYQNMVVMRHVGTSKAELMIEHKGLAECFHASIAQTETLRQWLENSSGVIQVFGNDQDEDFLILADLLQVDMIPLFDDLKQSDELV
ncbi:uncharacterized protein LOC128726985 [Anopheles nili]|uniref:uncharacterized protein LOC128726985 n=1 Tax=Anopheles nili TaxID=185578 RepID=UPI00237BB183|nr:uncharacterized protein LOC128726985 [Anopheles nili]